jgi:hypothetical protein
MNELPSRKRALARGLAEWIRFHEKTKREFEALMEANPDRRSEWVLAWTAGSTRTADDFRLYNRRCIKQTGWSPWPEDIYEIDRRDRKFFVRYLDPRES